MNPQVRESDAAAAANATAQSHPFVNALTAPKMVIVPAEAADQETDHGPGILAKRRKRKTRLANRR